MDDESLDCSDRHSLAYSLGKEISIILVADAGLANVGSEGLIEFQTLDIIMCEFA